MGSLKTKLITFLITLLPLSILGQSYNYTYTDPCTKVSKRLTIPFSGGVVVNYFGNVQTFTSNDFSTGVFESWIEQLSQINSSSPCQEITTTLVNNINNLTISNTLTIVTNIIAVTNVAQSLSSIAGSIGNMGDISSQNETSDTTETNIQPTTGNQTNQNSQGNETSYQSSGGTNGEAQGGNTSNDSTTQGGEQQAESTITQESSLGGNNLVNSLSNAVDGGSGESSSTNKNLGSLIASGDIVAISNTDQTQNFRFVGSITHANTKGTRIKGVLFNYTSGVDNLNVTFYKSWINKSRKLNIVGAQSFMMDFDKNFFSTTTVLESYKFNKKITGMFGLNFTAGKMGERELFNLSAVGGGHTSYQVNKRISGSVLLLGVYSPFTQFYEGKWWDAGVLIVPFNSWDIKITKTFKYNISFTGVYQTGESFLNYQILTGGKINF